MPPPFKCRRVHANPAASYFKPQGIPMIKLEEIVLRLDELEAIRLADLEGNYHEDSAKAMNISRQTFGNIVESARRKIADAIVNGKALKIEGGSIELVQNSLQCRGCRNKWGSQKAESARGKCPKCGGTDIFEESSERQAGESRCRRHGWKK
ncbi:MAG: hypothetical protein A2X49_12765 [Lentisphaerae bacterium GWF2_52_8]|nr:MAG: hypothetical protein A2X49_12765 [Lentisphaerae bacterium GWF2_52_8]